MQIYQARSPRIKNSIEQNVSKIQVYIELRPRKIGIIRNEYFDTHDVPYSPWRCIVRLTDKTKDTQMDLVVNNP